MVVVVGGKKRHVPVGCRMKPNGCREIQSSMRRSPATKLCQPLLLLEKLGIFPHIYSTIINERFKSISDYNPSECLLNILVIPTPDI